ncbi:pilus assembly protein CpaF [Anaerocolumna jejuensis DSM 15929]|uniref:Pilus assembly protein CpaF n=1 Tax=Anaerocolumna jejuensis DSM 15929 TaxID=1121322 RepID=A0A1M6UKM4_9FIRM|nr:ATPase, T2SS/T4P/T4SS family [Anaerocolumna jejuensis]SHK69719.1 pilus assembly protein CpaF [Anaerocolumna jejuensis DSM 15929]
MSNFNLGLASIIAITLILFFLYVRAKAKKQVVVEEDLSSFEEVLDALKIYIVNLTKEDSISSLETDEDLKRLAKRKAQRKEALKNSVYGIDSAKLMVKEMIHTFLDDHMKPEKMRQIIGLDRESEPNTNTMFEIIMYKYKKDYGRDALTKWILENEFEGERPAVGIGGENDRAYYITKTDLEESYFKLEYHLTDPEVTDIFTTLLYQAYKGFGCIDTLAEMNVNGYNVGVSGSVMDAINVSSQADGEENADACSEATNALWLYFKGSYIHLQFLDFGSEDEIRRIVQLLIRWNSPGPLSAKRGYLVNTMHDKSRILAVRPPAGEVWAAFVRKFTLDIITPEALVIKPGVTDGEVAIKLIEFLMRGQITTAVTGRQGSGKTTLMKAIIAYMDPRYNIRVLEMAPEMYLREIYPNRNIYSVQETGTVTAESLQDALKKSDSSITIIGEVATDPVAARMIQLAMTGSLFTLFSHHANEAKDLVLTLRNSLVNAGGFDNMTTAEKQVTDVLKINIHLDFTPDGKRYIKRITEITQLEEGIPYPGYNNEIGLEESRYELDKEYYTRQTDRISFSTRDVLVYNTETDTYMAKEEFSDGLTRKIREVLSKKEREEFDRFLAYYWRGESMEEYQGVARKEAYDDTAKFENARSAEENAVDFNSALAILSNRSSVAKQFNMGD